MFLEIQMLLSECLYDWSSYKQLGYREAADSEEIQICYVNIP